VAGDDLQAIGVEPTEPVRVPGSSLRAAALALGAVSSWPETSTTAHVLPSSTVSLSASSIRSTE
jgi:hypothetical protein